MLEQSVTRVFISYSRKDTDFVARLKDALQAKGYDAFVDTEDISGGEEWQKRLDQLLLNADAVAFVVSPDSVASRVCDWETKHALDLGKRLIPLLWRPVGSEQTPHQLTERNYIFFDHPDRFEAALEQLCNACDVDIGWVREHTRLVDLATRWNADGRGRDGLLRGGDLVEAKAWAARRTPRAPEIPAAFQDYVAASERDEARARANRRWRTAALSTLAALLVASAFAFTTQDEWRPPVDTYLRYHRFAHSSAELAAAPPGTVFQDCQRGSADCPAMVIIPAGSALIGNNSAQPTYYDMLYETPRNLSLRRFSVSQYEITLADWKNCVRDMSCEARQTDAESDTVPVVNVSWNDAHRYVAWLSRVTGADYRLLTEVEWEYAARGVVSSRDSRNGQLWGHGDEVQRLGEYAWYQDNSDYRAHQVGTRTANAFGLRDMQGNVAEWVEDCHAPYDPTSLSAAAIEFTERGARCSTRVVRGGSFRDDADSLRSGHRDLMEAGVRSDEIGFRIARTLGPPQSAAEGRTVGRSSTQPRSMSSPDVPIASSDAADAVLNLDAQRLLEYIDRGWNPNSELDPDRNAALHDLDLVCQRNPGHSRRRMLSVASLLIAAGADVTQKNIWDDTPLSITIASRYCGPEHPLLAFLRAHGRH